MWSRFGLEKGMKKRKKDDYSSSLSEVQVDINEISESTTALRRWLSKL